MDVERETLVKFAVPVVIVAGFVALIVAIGVLFGGPPSTTGTATPTKSPGVELSDTGAFALVGAMVLFIVAMAIGGTVIATDDEDGDGE